MSKSREEILQFRDGTCLVLDPPDGAKSRLALGICTPSRHAPLRAGHPRGRVPTNLGPRWYRLSFLLPCGECTEVLVKVAPLPRKYRPGTQRPSQAAI